MDGYILAAYLQSSQCGGECFFSLKGGAQWLLFTKSVQYISTPLPHHSQRQHHGHPHFPVAEMKVGLWEVKSLAEVTSTETRAI